MALKSVDSLGWTTFSDISFLVYFWLEWPQGRSLGDSRKQKWSSSYSVAQTCCCLFVDLPKWYEPAAGRGSYLSSPGSSFNSSGSWDRSMVSSVMEGHGFCKIASSQGQRHHAWTEVLGHAHRSQLVLFRLQPVHDLPFLTTCLQTSTGATDEKTIALQRLLNQLSQ